MQGIKSVIFDFDGTIINSAKGFDVASEIIKSEYQRLLAKKGANLDIEPHWALLRNTMREIDAQKQYNRNIWWNLLLKKVDTNGIQFTKAECKHLTKLYWDTTIEFTEYYPDTLDVLEYLKGKGYLLGLITDTDGEPGLKQNRLEKSGLIDFFDCIIISGEDIPEIKPDPAPFLALLSNLHVTASESVMIGDKPFTDIKGGVAAGLYTVLIQREAWTIDPPPDYQIKELIELKQIL
ncbi:MAG: HAD family hydrolase [Candidatus Helarchaeota archaeon]